MASASFVTTRLWNAVGWSMLHYLWVGAVLGLVALAGYWLLRSTRSNVRYCFALGCFVALAIAPMCIAIRVFESPASQPSSSVTNWGMTPLDTKSASPPEFSPAEVSLPVSIATVDADEGTLDQALLGRSIIHPLAGRPWKLC